jgi:hypothetical protein
MKQYLAITAFLSLLAPLAAPADECKVLDPELQGTYAGGCRNGLAHGWGVAKGEAEYEGEFRNGAKEGQGVKTWPWGDRYEGGFRADRRHGKGVYVWGSASPWAGERFEGDYVADKREGNGVYWWPNGDRFEGVWKADQRYGYSALEIRRQAAEKARAEAYAPGVQVCAWSKIGLAHTVLQVGQVQEIRENTVEVKLLRSEGADALVAASGPQPGQVVSGTLSEWALCL